MHPVGIDFHGRELEFEKVVCGEDPCGQNIVPILRKPFYNNLDIVNNRTLIAEAVGHRVKEDSLYDGVDGHKSEYDIDMGSLSMKEYILLMPACGYQ